MTADYSAERMVVKRVGQSAVQRVGLMAANLVESMVGWTVHWTAERMAAQRAG